MNHKPEPDEETDKEETAHRRDEVIAQGRDDDAWEEPNRGDSDLATACDPRRESAGEAG
jgi:hypothetical protein